MLDQKWVYKDLSPRYSNNVLVGLDDAYDHDAIKNSLRNIFLVEKNTAPGKPWFGNPLSTEIFELFGNTTETTAFTAVQNAIAKFEPRVRLEDLTVSMVPEYNRIIVNLKYSTIDNPEREENLIIPFSHNDVTYLVGRSTTVLQAQ